MESFSPSVFLSLPNFLELLRYPLNNNIRTVREEGRATGERLINFERTSSADVFAWASSSEQ